MSQSGFNRGYNQGRLQGVKTGLGMARHMSGFKSGTVSGVVYNKEKLQDPVLLTSARSASPFFFWNSENVTLSGTTVTAVTNLVPAGRYNPEHQSADTAMVEIGSAAYVAGAVYNNRAAINFGGGSTGDAFSTNNTGPSMTNTSEMTMIMVCKPSSSGILFWKEDTPGGTANTLGDLRVTFNGTAIQVRLLGNVTGPQVAIYETNSNRILNNWIVLTVKARLSSPEGTGSYLDIFINGSRNKYLVSDNITSLPTIATDTWANAYISFGNNGNSSSPGTQPGGLIAAGLIIEDWINESQQLRLENYFRDYYGIKF